jgi:C4-dicarboxylate-specific signal transduction histidine kinase
MMLQKRQLMPLLKLAGWRQNLERHGLAALAIAWAAAVFVADSLTPRECVVSGLYVLVVLMAGQLCRGRRLWLVVGLCSILTLMAQILARRFSPGTDPSGAIGAFNSMVSIAAIVSSAYLVGRGQAAESALRQAQAELERAMRVTTMGELTASIAHEVNQPIAAVVTNASACLRWLGAEPANLDQARAAVARIVRDGTRAAEIISRIRMIFTKESPGWQSVDMNELLRETLDMLIGEQAMQSVSVRADFAVGLPHVISNRVQLQQVVVNLLTNALESMQETTGPRELIVTSSLSTDEEVTISIGDTGVGLPTQEIDRIFNAFFTTKPQGTGMGLSICRSIIEKHDGRLWAIPNQPGGAIFCFAIPVRSEWAEGRVA